MNGFLVTKPEDNKVNEIIYNPYKLTLWEAVKNFFNSHLNENVRRKELCKFIEENFYEDRERVRKKTSFTTMDTYRNYLYKAGYLIKIKTGVYRSTREIPYRLTLKQVVYEAYHSNKKSNRGPYAFSSTDYKTWTTPETSTHYYRKYTVYKNKEEFLKEEDFKV